MSAWGRWGLAGLAAVACGACGDVAEPEQQPTTAQLSRFAGELRVPAYWLGPRVRGLTVSHAGVERGRVELIYGAWACDSGCVDSGGVWTGPREIGPIARFEYADTSVDPADCWTRVRNAVAVLLGCNPDGYPQELVIYSGRRQILVTSLYAGDGRDELPARTVARGLRPLNSRAAWPLLRPEPLSCHQLRRVNARYRRAMPAPLRPRTRC